MTTTQTIRQSMIRDEYDHLHGECDTVCEVGRGHVGTGRLHIALPISALMHLASQVPGLDVDVDTGLAWCQPSQVARVRDVAAALAGAR